MTTTSSLRSLFSMTLLAFSALSLTGLAGCNPVASKLAPAVAAAPTLQTIAPALQMVTGDYVSEGYRRRAQGYDWVAVSVQPYGNDQIDIKVRARSDIKKPTCHFDGQATFMGQDEAHGIIFQATINNSMAFFQFKEDKLAGSKLIIDSQDKYALNTFCSGGASLVGDYQKLKVDLAQS